MLPLRCHSPSAQILQASRSFIIGDKFGKDFDLLRVTVAKGLPACPPKVEGYNCATQLGSAKQAMSRVGDAAADGLKSAASSAEQLVAYAYRKAGRKASRHACAYLMSGSCL